MPRPSGRGALAPASFAEYFITEGRKGLAPEAVGEVVYQALTAAKPKVRYAVVGKKLQDWTLPRLLPKRMVDRLIGRQTGLLRERTSRTSTVCDPENGTGTPRIQSSFVKAPRSLLLTTECTANLPAGLIRKHKHGRDHR